MPHCEGLPEDLEDITVSTITPYDLAHLPVTFPAMPLDLVEDGGRQDEGVLVVDIHALALRNAAVTQAPTDGLDDELVLVKVGRVRD